MHKKVKKEKQIIAYKGFDEDLSCRGFQYKIGKEYCLEGELELCANGFHACQNPLDVFVYYPMSSYTRYAMVELFGDVDFAIDNEKLCATNIRIVKEMSIDELVEIGIMSSLPKKDLENWFYKIKQTVESIYLDENKNDYFEYIVFFLSVET